MNAKARVDAGAILRERARLVFWGALVVAAIQGVGVLLARNHVGAVVLSLVIAEFGCGRLGVAWSDPKEPEPAASALARRAGRGAAVGATAGLALLSGLLALHQATLTVDAPSVSTLFVGALVAVFGAARDELVFRGLLLRVLGPRATLPQKVGAAALAGAAGAWGAGAAPLAIGAAAILSVGLMALWLRDRGAWLAVGAHGALAIVLGPLATGGLADVRMKGGAGFDETPLALVAFALFAAFAVRWVLSPPPKATTTR